MGGNRSLFWAESVLAALNGALVVDTMISREWIEVVFGVDPDHGNGSLEWLIIAGVAILTILFALAARYEWRRLSIADRGD